MKSINVNDHDQLLEYVQTLIENNQPVAQAQVNYMLPPDAAAGYLQDLHRFEGLMDSSANLADPKDAHVARSLAAIGQDYFKHLAVINGMLYAEQMALNMAQGVEYEGVRFTVAESVIDKIYSERSRLLDESVNISHDVHMCLAAMNSVVNGVPFDVNYINNAVLNEDDEITTVDPDLDEEPNDFEDYDAYEEPLTAEALDESFLVKAAESMGEGFEELAQPDGYNSFTGDRRYNSATFRIDMSRADGLTMDNYAEFLNTPAGKEWASKAVNNMMRSFYGDERYTAMVKNNANMFAGIYIDGEAAYTKFGNQIEHNDRCAALMMSVLEGGHRLNISPLEKGSDGQYHLSDDVCPVNIEPSLAAEEEFSLWKAILRFFRFHVRTRAEKLAEKVGFSELTDQETVSRIRDLNASNKDYVRSIKPITDAYERHEKLYTNVNTYAFASHLDDPNVYFIDATKYYADVPSTKENPYGLNGTDVTKTMGRLASRSSLAALLMISRGMSIEQLTEPDDAAKEQMKAIGKEFIDNLTMPSPIQIAKQEQPDITDEELKERIKLPEFRQRYEAAALAKVDKIIAMYGEMDNGLKLLEAQLPDIDINDNRSIAAGYPMYCLFKTASCDMLQSLESEFLKQEPFKQRVIGMMDYADENQYKSAYREMVNAMTSNEMINSTMCDQNRLINNLVASITNRYFESGVGKGMAANAQTLAIATLQTCSLHAEISENFTKDPGVIQYAKELASGKKPMPEGLFNDMDSNFMQAYRLEKKQPSLQKEHSLPQL